MLEHPPTPPPERPGCYIFRGRGGRPLYVGKARDLKARVLSYFVERAPDKVVRLRREAVDLEYIVTASEWEALLLENNLIKQFRPPFNVLLKDDKTYPYLKLTVKDTYPKALFTRRPARDGALYFGPFVPGWQVRKNLRILQEHFKVATCSDPLDGSRPRPCLYYEMGQCWAPCIKGRVDPARYRRAIEEARLFLEGRTARLRRALETRMREAASAQEYERAAHYRDLWRASESLGGRQAVARPGEGHWELFCLYGGPESWLLASFTLLDGKIVDRRSWRVDEPALAADELFATLLTRLYGNAPVLPDGVAVGAPFDGMELLARFLSERKGRKVPLLCPRRGEKARALATLAENARLEFSSKADPVRVFAPLVEALGLSAPPGRIECFDISHSHGEATTASCAVWDGGRIERSRQRVYHVKTVAGVDDFASIAEVVGRRYAKMLEEAEPLPDLILIDGGQGQVNAARDALAALLPEVPPLLGLAKREEWLYRPGDPEPLVLPKDSPALHALMAVRDEAHRLAVSRHRARRAKARLSSPLLAVPGVGPVTAKKLLRAFLTTEAVRAATEGELAAAVGLAAARRIRAWANRPSGVRSEE